MDGSNWTSRSGVTSLDAVSRNRFMIGCGGIQPGMIVSLELDGGQAMDKARTMDGQDWLLLLLLSMLWGGSFFFAAIAVRELPPLTVVLVRVALASLTLLPFFWYFGHRLPSGWRQWLPFLGMGVLNNVLPFSLIFAGQTQIGAGLASIVNALTPLFTVIVLAGFGEERLTMSRGFGVLLGVSGVAVLHGSGVSGEDARLSGILLCMGGALSYGFSALWGRRRLSGVAPLKSATCQLICSTAVMAVVAGLIDRPWRLEMPGSGVLLALVALAILATALAYLLFFRLLVRAGAGNVMLVTLLIPVSAMTLAGLFLNEPVHLREIAGAATIGIGLLFIDGRAFGWLAALRTGRNRAGASQESCISNFTRVKH